LPDLIADNASASILENAFFLRGQKMNAVAGVSYSLNVQAIAVATPFVECYAYVYVRDTLGVVLWAARSPRIASCGDADGAQYQISAAINYPATIENYRFGNVFATLAAGTGGDEANTNPGATRHGRFDWPDGINPVCFPLPDLGFIVDCDIVVGVTCDSTAQYLSLTNQRIHILEF
jgi:hypothetical protein